MKRRKQLLKERLHTMFLPDINSPNPNFDGYMVIGAGLPRTGTTSMQAALQKLLQGPCYHMGHVFRNGKHDLDHWENVFNGNVSDKDWIHFLQKRGFRAGVDHPICHHFEYFH